MSTHSRFLLGIITTVPYGGIKEVNHSEWRSPTFIQPKKKGMVQFLSDFKKLNLRMHREPFLIPKIQYMLLNLDFLGTRHL